METTKKKSLVRNSMISLGGFFVAKLLGLVYTIPLASILSSDAYMNYYGTAFRIYSYILQVFTAGFPMVVATLVAMYTTLDDPKTVLKVKKMSLRFLSLTGFLGMILLMLLATPLGRLVAGDENAYIMRNVLFLLSLALFLVPVLSAYRGYIQGLKEIEEYAFSQTFEQFVRVGFLLGTSCLLVYAFHTERVWALYAAVSATAVSALAGLIQIISYSKKTVTQLEAQAAVQTTKSVDTRKLFKDFIVLSIPYFTAAVLGYIDDPINSFLLPSALKLAGTSTADVNVILSAANYVGSKLISIPMIVSPGFTAAIIPHISSSLAEKDYRGIRKSVQQVLSIVLYIAIPISFCIFLYARPVYYVMFYTEDLALSSSVVKWVSLEGLFGAVMPIVTNLMLALQLRKTGLKSLLLYSIVKIILIVPCVMLMGFPGAVLCSVLGGLVLLYNNLRAIRQRYHVNFSVLPRQLLVIAAGCLCMWGVCVLLNHLGFEGAEGSKLICLLRLMVNGIASVSTFLVFTWVFQLPQTIFGLNRRDRNV